MGKRFNVVKLSLDPEIPRERSFDRPLRKKLVTLASEGVIEVVPNLDSPPSNFSSSNIPLCGVSGGGNLERFVFRYIPLGVYIQYEGIFFTPDLGETKSQREYLHFGIFPYSGKSARIIEETVRSVAISLKPLSLVRGDGFKEF